MPCRERVTSACLNDLTGGYIRMEQVRPPIVAPVGSGQQTADSKDVGRRVAVAQNTQRQLFVLFLGAQGTRPQLVLVVQREWPSEEEEGGLVWLGHAWRSVTRGSTPCRRFALAAPVLAMTPRASTAYPTAPYQPACTRHVPCKRIRRPELPRSRTPRRPPSVQHPWLFPGTGNREETGKPRPCSRWGA